MLEEVTGFAHNVGCLYMCINAPSTLGKKKVMARVWVLSTVTENRERKGGFRERKRNSGLAVLSRDGWFYSVNYIFSVK